MNFDFSDDQKQMRDAARKFLTEKCPPKAVREVLDGKAAYDKALWQGLAEMGFLGVAIPEAFGGAGAGHLELCVIAEEMGRANAPVPFSSTVYLAAEALLLAGTDAIAAATPVVHDALVAGQDREFIGLLAWPNPHACRQMVGNPDATFEDVVRHPEVIACLKRGLEAHNASATGSSMRIARAMLMAEPPSIDGNELTDKGYINQRAGLERRAALVGKLYTDKPGEDVIILN